MPVKAGDFLLSAQALMVGSSVTEIDCRNATSRAYYCGYHMGKIVFDNHQVPPFNRGGEHQRMTQGLIKSENPDLRNIGRLLAKALHNRTLADYHITQECNRLKAESTISLIQAVKQAVEKL